MDSKFAATWPRAQRGNLRSGGQPVLVSVEQHHRRCALHERLQVDPLDHLEQQAFAVDRAVTKNVASLPALVCAAPRAREQSPWPGEDRINIVAEIAPGPIRTCSD